MGKTFLFCSGKLYVQIFHDVTCSTLSQGHVFAIQGSESRRVITEEVESQRISRLFLWKNLGKNLFYSKYMPPPLWLCKKVVLSWARPKTQKLCGAQHMTSGMKGWLDMIKIMIYLIKYNMMIEIDNDNEI